MLEDWRKQWRARLLARLRPGRDEAELLEMIGRAEAIQSDDHRRMLESLVMFRDVRVRELMVPRSEIVALETGMTLARAAKEIAGHAYSKLPVFAGDLDHIEGIIHAWDVFSTLVRDEKKSLSGLLRPCLKVPESQLAMGLLGRMKQQGMHIAIVVDEFGGTGGLITLSNLLTEIVGSMDEAGGGGEEEECIRKADGSFIVAGRMHVEDLEDILGQSLPHGDYDTVGGLISNQCGRIPEPGERLEVAGLAVHVLEAEPRRILKLHITPPVDAPAE